MPTVTIEWKFQTHRINVNGMTVLQEVLNESIKYFKLSSPTGSPLNNKYKLILSSNQKELDLTIPFRFLNLAQGVKLELIEEEINEDDNDGKPVIAEKVNIRCTLTIQGETKLVTKKFPNDTIITDMIQEFLKDVGEDVGNFQNHQDELNIQMMMKQLDRSEWCKQLRDVGLRAGNHAIRIVSVNRDASKLKVLNRRNEEITAVQSQLKSQLQPKHNMSPNKPIKKQFNPQSSGIIVETIVVQERKGADAGEQGLDSDSDADSLYEMDLSQARKYQQLLAKRAHPPEEPLLTKSLRDKMEREKEKEKEKSPSLTVIRVFLPNGQSVRISMRADLTLWDLVEVLRERVLEPSISQQGFSLVEGVPQRMGNIVVGPNMTEEQLRDGSLQEAGLGAGARASLVVSLLV